jgi:hypothetical protein
MSGRADRVERSVDLADMAKLDGLAFRAGQTFRRIGGLYLARSITARRASSDAAVWISTALADAGLARSLERWTSDNFGDLSNVYTKALDGEFVKGLQAGADYVSPWCGVLRHQLSDRQSDHRDEITAEGSKPADHFLGERIVREGAPHGLPSGGGGVIEQPVQPGVLKRSYAAPLAFRGNG